MRNPSPRSFVRPLSLAAVLSLGAAVVATAAASSGTTEPAPGATAAATPTTTAAAAPPANTVAGSAAAVRGTTDGSSHPGVARHAARPEPRIRPQLRAPAERPVPARASRSTRRTRPRVARAPRAPRALIPLSDPVWARLRRCESGGRYDINTGNGFYGAYQFLPSTWRGLGYPGMPHHAPPHVQDAAAQKLQARSGWGQWPACTRRLGLR